MDETKTQIKEKDEEPKKPEILPALTGWVVFFAVLLAAVLLVRYY